MMEKRTGEENPLAKERKVKNIWERSLTGKEKKVRFGLCIDESLFKFFSVLTGEVQAERKVRKKSRITMGSFVRIGLKLLKRVVEKNREVLYEGENEEEIVEKLIENIKK